MSGSASNLLLDLRPNTACDYHRIVMPFSYADIKPRVPVFVCNRMATGGLPELQRRKKSGEKIVVDIDDYWILDDSHYLYQRFAIAGMTELLINCLRLADVVTVTTPHLASRVREINRSVVVIPNALPFDRGQFTRSENKYSDRTFIWAGGASHRDDLKLLPDAGKDLCIAGVKPGVAEWTHCLAGRRGHSVKLGLPLSEYMSVYDGHLCALAPLVDSEFNRCKSNLKMLEAGAKGLAFIASDVRPYLNEVDQDVVLYADSDWGFYEKMTTIKNCPQLAEEQAQNLSDHVRKNYHLDDANELRRQVIESFS